MILEDDILFTTKSEVSSSAHKVNTIQHVDRISMYPVLSFLKIGPLGGSDFHSFNYQLSSIIEESTCFKPHQNIESLKTDLVKIAALIPL